MACWHIPQRRFKQIDPAVEIIIATGCGSMNNAVDALRYGATRVYLDERAQLFEMLGVHGVLSLDSTAARLPIDLTNQYLKIKASGRL